MSNLKDRCYYYKLYSHKYCSSRGGPPAGKSGTTKPKPALDLAFAPRGKVEVASFVPAGVPEALHQSGALHYLGQVIEAQAATLGFQDGFVMITVMFVLTLIPAWILGRAKRRVGGGVKTRAGLRHVGR